MVSMKETNEHTRSLLEKRRQLQLDMDDINQLLDSRIREFLASEYHWKAGNIIRVKRSSGYRTALITSVDVTLPWRPKDDTYTIEFYIRGRWRKADGTWSDNVSGIMTIPQETEYKGSLLLL